MSNVEYEQATLDRHASEIADIAERTKTAVETAKSIKLGDASYGQLVGPIACPIANHLIEGFADTCDALADAVSGSADGMQATAHAYRTTEENNATLAKGVTRV